MRGSVCRATDDAGSWLLLTEWESVGAYRRGLGGYQVKLLATPLLSQALDQPSAFEELLRIDQDGLETARPVTGPPTPTGRGRLARLVAQDNQQSKTTKQQDNPAATAGHPTNPVR